MSIIQPAAPTTWIVCEDGDRWYRAMCRFAGSAVGARSTTLRIERIGNDLINSVVTRTKWVRGSVVVLWELPLANTDYEICLDLIATIRTEVPLARQVASLPTTASTDFFLAAQEAGISMFAQSLGSLETVVEAISQSFSPLG